jgi:hypothetical protein
MFKLLLSLIYLKLNFSQKISLVLFLILTGTINHLTLLQPDVHSVYPAPAILPPPVCRQPPHFFSSTVLIASFSSVRLATTRLSLLFLLQALSFFLHHLLPYHHTLPSSCKSGFADPFLPTNVFNGFAGFVLAKNKNDLRRRKPFLFHN